MIVPFILHRVFTIIKEEILMLPSRILVFLFLLILLLFPVIIPDLYLLRILIFCAIYALLTASWDLLSGFTGQINFGHALFFGLGAYASALLNLYLKVPPVISIPAGALVAVLAGLIIGIPCLRLKGVYLALTTIAFPIILTGIIFIFPDITGGEIGLSGLDKLTGSRISDYYLITAVAAIGCFIMLKITTSNTGIIFHAIREDELGLRIAGINTIKYKLLAFCLSGLFAGLAGGLYAHFMRTIGPSLLGLSTSFSLLIYAIFGGICTIYGSVAAVYILFPLLEVFHVFPEFRMLMFAIVILLVILFMPKGLIRWILFKIERYCPRCNTRSIALLKTCRVCKRYFQSKRRSD